MPITVRGVLIAAALNGCLISSADAQRRGENSLAYGIYGGVGFYGDDVGPAIRLGALMEKRPEDFPLILRGEAEYQRIFTDNAGRNVLAILGSTKFFFPRTTGRGNTPIYALAGFGPYVSSRRGDTDSDIGFHLAGGYESKTSANRTFFEGRLIFVSDVTAISAVIGMKF
jgi:hypothetical protein